VCFLFDRYILVNDTMFYRQQLLFNPVTVIGLPWLSCCASLARHSPPRRFIQRLRLLHLILWLVLLLSRALPALLPVELRREFVALSNLPHMSVPRRLLVIRVRQVALGLSVRQVQCSHCWIPFYWATFRYLAPVSPCWCYIRSNFVFGLCSDAFSAACLLSRMRRLSRRRRHATTALLRLRRLGSSSEVTLCLSSPARRIARQIRFTRSAECDAYRSITNAVVNSDC
jgi:hypothetical protein